MFTVEQRDALREGVLLIARNDQRIVAGAAVGSLAADGGDRFSDLDLTFAVGNGISIDDVLHDFTRTLCGELGAVVLIDLQQGPRTYRVFLFPGALQFDLSLSQESDFIPAGPRFRLLFGKTAGPAASPSPPDAANLFGWGVIYALHSRACIERGRIWQAEHYVGTVRDHALALACLRHGVPAIQARGYDDLPSEVLARFDGTHVTSLEADALRVALAAAARALLDEGEKAEVPSAKASAERLADLL